MTPAPWVVSKHRNQTLLVDAHGQWIALLTTEAKIRSMEGFPEVVWTMDPGNLRVMIASPKLLAAVKTSTTQLIRLKTKHPEEVGLEIYIEHNQRLIEAIEEET